MKEFEQRFDYEDDDLSSYTKISNKSLVDSIVPLNDSYIRDILNDDDSSLSSQSIVSINSDQNCNSLSVVKDPTSNTINLASSQEDNNEHENESISDILHIPDGFDSIYYSSENDKVKKKQLFEFDGYLTDSLLEEMSTYYPKPEDMSTDPATNDVMMDKEQFPLNFSKMYPKGRVFLNQIQLRESISECFNHWNLLSKSNGKSVRCSYSFTPGKKDYFR